MPRPKKEKQLPNGRPKIPIDWNEVEKSLMAGCHGTEIAAQIGMHPETFYDRCTLEHGIGFTEYSTEKKRKGDRLLRAAQFNNAINKNNTTMQIWLGKQRLGQKENLEEVNISPEIFKQYDAVMNLIQSYQDSKRRNDANIISKD